MSNTFFWGLTVNDIKHAGWNSFDNYVVFFAGAVAGAIANRVAKQFFGSQKAGNKPKPSLATFALGTIGGAAACYFLTKRLEYTTFAAEKALKFFVIHLVMGGSAGALLGSVATIIALIGAGGAGGYFGPSTLYTLGSFGAAFGSILSE